MAAAGPAPAGMRAGASGWWHSFCSNRTSRLCLLKRWVHPSSEPNPKTALSTQARSPTPQQHLPPLLRACEPWRANSRRRLHGRKHEHGREHGHGHELTMRYCFTACAYCSCSMWMLPMFSRSQPACGAHSMEQAGMGPLGGWGSSGVGLQPERVADSAGSGMGGSSTTLDASPAHL